MFSVGVTRRSVEMITRYLSEINVRVVSLLTAAIPLTVRRVLKKKQQLRSRLERHPLLRVYVKVAVFGTEISDLECMQGVNVTFSILASRLCENMTQTAF